MVVNIDLHKAYDSLSWNFLELVLNDFRFPDRIMELILYSLKESSISILWNKERLTLFSPGRRLRQGDPLAPYMFILAL